MYQNHRSGFKQPFVPASAQQVPQYDGPDYDNQYEKNYPHEPATQQATYQQPIRRGADMQAPLQEPKAANGPQGKYPEYFSIKIHGTKAALNFVPDITRKNFLTVSIEAAEMLNQANRTYNWGNKTRLQLTRSEYLEVVAVLLGMGETCRCNFTNHGSQGGPKKGFQLEHQGRHVFVSVYETNKPIRAVPVPLMEAIQIAHMMISIYVDNFPGITSDTVMTSLNQAIHRREMESRKQSELYLIINGVLRQY